MTLKEFWKKIVALAKSRYKKNTYTQGSKRSYVGGYPREADGAKGFSDCSSFARWLYKKLFGFDIGYNTSAQIQNRGRGILVEKAKSNQTYPTISLLEPGDCIYWKGTPSHAWGVGHVEVYIGNGQCIGHGGGTGPTIKNLKSYSKGRGSGSKKYLCVIRWVKPEMFTDAVEQKLGSVLLKLGDENNMVMEMQKLLKQLGYGAILTKNGFWGPNKDGCDGEFGSDTKRAVAQFEKDVGLPADGIADVTCLEALKHATGVGRAVAIVTGNTVHIRQEPSSSSKILGVVKINTELPLIGESTESWTGVEYVYAGKDVKAFISSRYIKIRL